MTMIEEGITRQHYAITFRILFEEYVFEFFSTEGNQDIMNYSCPLHFDLYNVIECATKVHENNILQNTINIIRQKQNELWLLQALQELVNVSKDDFQQLLHNWILAVSCTN